MAQLPESHERDFLELLKPYASEEQKKSRRNIDVSSFIVLSIYFFGKSLTEVQVLGFNLHGSNHFLVLILASVLITYWLIMYLVYFRRDSEIQKEQEVLLLRHVQQVKERMNETQNQLNNIVGADTGGMRSHWSSELNNARNQYSIYERQQERTKKAGILNMAIHKVEFWLPVILAVTALAFILMDAVGRK